MAKFNGLGHVLRGSACFSIEPYEADYLGYERGAHTSSWVRRENGKVVLIALRKHRLDGGEGSGRYGDWLTTTASVVVASKTADDLQNARQLAIVPYGDGDLRLKRLNGPHIVRCSVPSEAASSPGYFMLRVGRTPQCAGKEGGHNMGRSRF
jgi:hypothetical protein